MKKIAKDSSNREYECEYSWDEDCFVQYGTNGLVVSENGNYETAFFEVFPKNPTTFIRGEGKTVEEAEKQAWEQLEKYKNCQKHEFERRGYTNGAGFCKHCGMFKSHAFEISTHCKICGKPTNYISDINGDFYCDEHSVLMPIEDMPTHFLELMIKDIQLNLKCIELFNVLKKYMNFNLIKRGYTLEQYYGKGMDKKLDIVEKIVQDEKEKFKIDEFAFFTCIFDFITFKKINKEITFVNLINKKVDDEDVFIFVLNVNKEGRKLNKALIITNEDLENIVKVEGENKIDKFKESILKK